MVCLSNEGTIQVRVRDTIYTNERRQFSVEISPTKTIDSVFAEISDYFKYEADSFELLLQNQNADTVSIFYIEYCNIFLFHNNIGDILNETYLFTLT